MQVPDRHGIEPIFLDYGQPAPWWPIEQRIIDELLIASFKPVLGESFPVAAAQTADGLLLS